MSLAPTSAGFGRGGFGRGPCGHGPWVTWQETPGYAYTGELAYAVTAHRFEDQTTQRVLRSRDRGHTLVYNFPSPDSATLCEVASWFQACQGPATRFVALDHRTRTPQVVRFADATLTTQRHDGMVRALPPMTLAVERAVTYADVVRGAHPSGANPSGWTGPDNWWRLSEPSGATSCADIGTAIFTAASRPGTVIQGCSFGAPGLLVGDRTTAVACTSAVIVFSGGFPLISDFVVSAVLQPTWPPRAFRPQPWFSLQGSGGLMLSLQLNSFGYAQAVSSGGVVLATASVTTLCDNQPHTVAYGYVAAFGGSALTIDGDLQTFVVGAPVVGVFVTSGGLCSNPRSSHYFDGTIGDVAFAGDASIDVEALALQARVRARL